MCPLLVSLLDLVADLHGKHGQGCDQQQDQKAHRNRGHGETSSEGLLQSNIYHDQPFCEYRLTEAAVQLRTWGLAAPKESAERRQRRDAVADDLEGGEQRDRHQDARNAPEPAPEQQRKKDDDRVEGEAPAEREGRQELTLDRRQGQEGGRRQHGCRPALEADDRNERSEEHTSELQSIMRNSDAVFCMKKKNAQ